MRHAEPAPDQAEPVHLFQQRRAAVADFPARGLVAGFGHMGLHRQPVFGRQRAAAAQEFVRAVQRNGGRAAQADVVARMRPGLRGGADRGERLRRAGHPHAGGAAAMRFRQCLDQSGRCLEEGEVGDHRREHGAQPDGGIGLRHRVQPLDGRAGEFGGHVEGRCAALLQHLDGGEGGRKPLILQAPPAADPGRVREQQGEVPFVARPLGQPAMAMGVAVDEAGDDQAARGVVPRRILHHRPRRQDGGDAPAFDQQIGEGGGEGIGGEDPRTGQEQLRHGPSVLASGPGGGAGPRSWGGGPGCPVAAAPRQDQPCLGKGEPLRGSPSPSIARSSVRCAAAGSGR